MKTLRLQKSLAQASYRVLGASLDAACQEQGIRELRERMRELIPDLSEHFTASFDSNSLRYVAFEEPKMRTQQAFQIANVLKFLEGFPRENLSIVDIGDSSGNHGHYLRSLAKRGKIGRVISVNIDPVAVEKARRRGGEAILCRAEEIDIEAIRPDVCMSFEMIEHLPDPLVFIRKLAISGTAEWLLVSAPYVRRSRFGGVELRSPEEDLPGRMGAEDLHIFELSPDDWQRLFLLGGYRTRQRQVYLQYPRRSWLRITAPWWQIKDFEGFVFFVLQRDLSVSQRYADW